MPKIDECFLMSRKATGTCSSQIETSFPKQSKRDGKLFVDLDFLNADWYLLKKPGSSRCFRIRFLMARPKSFIISLSKPIGLRSKPKSH